MDFRVLYDARVGVGYQVQVQDHVGTVVRCMEYPEPERSRQDLLAQARLQAVQAADELAGLVFIGYEPCLLNSDVLGV